MKQPTNNTQTIEITNFGGRLTRILNGEMNSGFAKFEPSFGYDPFSKPMNLTWFEQPVDITGPITDLIIAGKKYYGTSGIGYNNVQEFVALLGNGSTVGTSAGNLYVMQPAQLMPTSSIIANVDSVLGAVSVAGTFKYGGSLEVFQQPSVSGTSDVRAIYIGSDTHISTIPLGVIATGPQRVVSGNYVGTITAADGAFRPLKVFQGFLRFANSTTIATIGAAGTIVSNYSVSIRGVTNVNSDLQTPLPLDSQIQDMDVSIDGNYLLLATSNVDSQQIGAVGSDITELPANDSVLYGWNGSDPNITTSTTMPSTTMTALQIYLGNNLFFAADGFGASLTNGTNKILTLPKNSAPYANATAVNGNFLTWASVEINSGGNGSNASLFYFGSLDQENPTGLYRMMRQTTTSAFVSSVPLNLLVDNRLNTVNATPMASVTPIGYGKHYISILGPNFGGTGTLSKLYRFLVNSTGSGFPQAGVYETQTQLFSKRIGVSQIRIYTEPTVQNNAFKIDMIGSDGQPIQNGTFTYNYGDVQDSFTGSNSLERINFNPDTKTLYALGIRVTNAGTTNMTIKKIEVDYTEEGR